jgi:hypothetical protein
LKKKARPRTGLFLSGHFTPAGGCCKPPAESQERRFALNRSLTLRLPRGFTISLSAAGSEAQIQRFDRTLAFLGQASLWLLALLVLVSRDPFRLLDAPLWAEDGPLWIYDAYTTGIASLAIPHTGYLQTFPRLVGFSTDIVPLKWVPTIFVLAGFLVQVAPAWFLLSARGKTLIPNLWARLLLIIFYLGVPNSFETFVNVTNAQWHIAIIMFLIIIMTVPKTPFWRVIECAGLVVGGLSGPFSFVLAPLAWWQARTENALLGPRGIQALILTLTAVVQAGFVFASAGTERHLQPLGASIWGFARITVGQIFLAAIIGSKHVSRLEQTPLWHANPFPLVLLIVFLAITVLAFRKGPPAYRVFTVFAVLIYASALWSPVISTTQPQWDALEVPGAGSRYYLLPTLAWFAGLLVLAGDRHRVIRRAAQVLILLSAIGVRTDWEYLREPETHFFEAAELFDTVPVGTKMIFREAPDPNVWLFSLTKK